MSGSNGDSPKAEYRRVIMMKKVFGLAAKHIDKRITKTKGADDYRQRRKKKR